MSDYKIPFNSLSQYIPPNMANAMNTSLMSTIFDKMLTKEESSRLYGVIGDKGTINLENKPYIVESTTDRYFNSLCPALYYKIGAEENVFTFKDMLNKAKTMGIDISLFNDWGKVNSLNFMPPINIDKFINFSQYFWIQSSIPNQDYEWNPNQLPEYYTIERPLITDTVKYPVDIATSTNIALNGTLQPISIWSVTFIDATHFSVSSFNTLEFGEITGQSLSFSNNSISFDILLRTIDFVNGDTFTITIHPLTNKPSSISFIGIGNGYITNVLSRMIYGSIDGVQLSSGMRILVKNQNNILENGIYTVSAEDWQLTNDNQSDQEVFVKTGSQIGTWTMSSGLASFVSLTPNISIWAETNYWVHKDDLVDLNLTSSTVIQAVRPIIEYNNDLELNTDINNYKKIKFNQAPLFNLFDYNSMPIIINGSQLCSAIFYYKEDPTSAVDQYLQRRVVTDNFNFMFEQGLSYQNKTVFFKKAGVLDTIWTKDSVNSKIPEYVTVDINGQPIVINPTTDINSVGDWLTPFQLNRNPQFENRTNIAFGDLNDHFTNIISNQPGIIGSYFGSNNFRKLTPNLGLGGTINLIDNQFNLYMGLLNQHNITPITLIDFAEQQYEDSINSLIQYIELNIGSILTNNCNSSNLILDIFNEYKTNYAIKGELKNAYQGSLNPIPNWPMTLPLLGVMNAVQPQGNVYNPILFTHVNVHHDGHQSPIYLRSIPFEQSLTGLSVLRYDGTSTQGYYGTTPPIKPYKGQLWFDSSANLLKTFVVDFEGIETPLSPANGQYWYDRISNVLQKYVTGNWITSSDDRWEVFSISDTYNALIIHAETELYNYWKLAFNTQPLVWDLTNPLYDQEKYLGFELSKFAIANNLDPYGSNYDPKDAYTWNYSQCVILQSLYPSIPAGTARWHKVYEAYFGTARPDLEPWKILGITSTDLAIALGISEATMIADLTTTASAPTWSYVLANTTMKICVDPLTGILLPPYVSSTLAQGQYALISDYSQIIGAANHYKFGDEGITELVWRNTVDFNYSLFRSSLKIDPINCLTKTWGFQTFNVNGLNFDKITKNILTHYEFTLHSELRKTQISNPVISGMLITSDLNSYTIDLTVSSMVEDNIILCNFEQNLSIKVGNIVNHCIPINGPEFNITVLESSIPLLLGDIIRVSINADIIEFSYISSNMYVYNGLNQTYVNLKKYNNQSLSGDYNDYALRKWNANLIYRTDSIIETNALTISTEKEGLKINPSSYEIFLKINNFSKSSWLHALRIQVTQIGNYKGIAPNIFIPSSDGNDWSFRIENYFPRFPSLEKYNTDINGIYETFTALDGKNTNLSWKNFIELIPGNEKSIVHLPINITGIQNVVTFLNEYIMFATDEGWAVGQSDKPEQDVVTGRAITWQLEVEKFIDALYKGVSAGQGLVINPFLKNLWFNTPSGLVSNFKHENYDDISTGQLVYDIAGDIIQPSALMVIRSDEQTSITGQVPMFGCHLNVNEYEHILIFKNYNNPSLSLGLLYDQFLGSKTSKLMLDGKRQTNQTNRPTYGGFFLKGNETVKNLAAAIDDVANYYNADSVYDNKLTTSNAMALFGFAPKTYFSNLNINPKTEFNFWRGMISAKGSNYSFEAFINSAKFETAKIDEFWAYKVAEYGDAREKDFPELKIEPNDTVLKHTRLFFSGIENDTPNESMTIIANDDEARWFTISDLNSNLYFSAQALNTFYVTTTVPNQLVQLPVPADQLIVFGSEADTIKLEQYVQDINNLAGLGTNPDGSFKRADEMKVILNDMDAMASADTTASAQIVNSSFINFTIPGDYSVVSYVPMRPKYSPIQLYDYVSNVHIEDIGIWHPAYNIHTAEALEIINTISNVDPTKYNYSLLTSNNPNYNPLKCWGAKEVGRVWWDTTNLDYIPYYDQYIYPSFEERLTRWGSLAEYSGINVYEWISSNVPPSQYNALALTEQGDSSIANDIRKTGIAANQQLYRSDRTWQGRAIAWSYVPNPSATTALQMFTYAADKLHLSTTEIGPVTVVLENGTFAQYLLTSGMHIGGWIINKPYGELVLGSTTGYFVGSSSTVGDTSITYPGNTIFSHFIVNLNKGITVSISVGQIDFTVDIQGTNYYLTGTNNVTKLSQSILIVPINGIVGTNVDYNFTTFGFTISAYILSNSSNYSDIVNELVSNIDLHIRNYQSGTITIPFNTTLMDNQLPVVSPVVYSLSLSIDGLINIRTVDITLNEKIIGNYTLSYNGDYLILSNNGNFVQQILISTISLNFDIVFDIMTFTISMVNITSISNFLAEFTDLTSIVVVGLDGENVSFVTSNPNVVITDYNWRGWSIPKAADLLADQSTPFSSWNAVYGDWVDLPPTKDIITSIALYNKTPLTLNSGTKIEAYNSVWSEWRVLSDELQHKISYGSILSFTMSGAIEQNYFSLYVNGINQLTSTYTIDPKYPTIVTLNNIIPIGSKVTAYLRKYEPTTAELAFDPTIVDVPSTLTKYKIDYEYVTQVIRDNSGQITGNTYYFWVKNKSIANRNKALSSQQAALLLQFGPSLYLTFQDLRLLSDDGYETIKFFDLSRYEMNSYFNLGVVYKAITIANLGTFVTADNTYKLRFTRDFTLREDPIELDLKNTHTEWTLMRPNDFKKIPQLLWDKLVDSACGENITGTLIPSNVRIDYDKRHGTQTRYGFEADQIFIDSELLKTSLVQAITNPKTTKWVKAQTINGHFVEGHYIPDMINNLDYSNSSSWFSTPASTRQVLTQIWNTATGQQINGIFFEVLNDALANNYQFTEIFKTSRISVHSISTN